MFQFLCEVLKLLTNYKRVTKNDMVLIKIMFVNFLCSIHLLSFADSAQLSHSSGYLRNENHDLVFPRITKRINGIKRETTSAERSDSLIETMIRIRAENLNKTFYVVIYPNNDFSTKKLSIEGIGRMQKQIKTESIDNNCLYTGVIVSPVSGKAAITRCDNSDKMYALMITETEGTFVLRPLDDTYYSDMKYAVKSDHKTVESNRSQMNKLLDKHNSDLKTESNWDSSEQINTDETENSTQFKAHVLVKVNQSETEFCDLAFIDENDRKRAFNEFISPNDQKIKTQSQISNELFGTKRRRRRRSSVTMRKTIETAVYIDQHLLNRFNGLRSDLTRLVLAIMNEVQLIYSFRTMKTRIKIVIVKLVFLSAKDNGPDTANGDIDQYLDNFCGWQSKKWRNEDTDKRWDHSLMLTGLDLFKQIGDKKNKKVLGLAWVNGMCKPTYSCTLNEGKSFEAAFVIAHEMGHSLGIMHDGTGNNCDPDKYIMSDKTGPGKINWSPCSNIYLDNFLTKANAKCLDDTVSSSGSPDLNYERTNRLPGEQYSPNKQCQLALGQQYRAYITSKEPFNDICRELWCMSESWATPAHPALEGSTCADGKKCVQGSCQSTASYVSRRSIKNSAKNRNEALPYQSTTDTHKQIKTKRSETKGLARSFMDNVQRFLRSATSGAQDFFKLFT